MPSVISLLIRSRRSLISAAGPVSRMGTYVHIPINRPLFTPHSFGSRCASLSTTPNSDTSDSGSREGSSDSKKTAKKTVKVGDNPNNILPDIPSSVTQARHSADLGTSAMLVSAISSDTPPKMYKPMGRVEKMAYLEDTIKSNYADIRSLSMEIASATKKQELLLEKKKLTSNETTRLRVIENVNLPDMRKWRDELVAQVAKHEAELSELKYPKEPSDAPISAQGI